MQRGDRVLAVRAVERVGRDFGQAQRAHLALLQQPAHFAHGFLDGHGFVPAVQVVKVDHVRAQALQTFLAVAPQRGRAAVDHAALDAVVAHHAGQAALAAQRDAVAVRRQHRADQAFIGAETVERGRVEQRHALVQGMGQQLAALLGAGRRAVGMVEVHTAQADGSDVERADFACLHGSILEKAKPAHAVRVRWPGGCEVRQACPML
ncbi:hypothetical protein D3C78_1276830 [compost metagenome]